MLNLPHKPPILFAQKLISKCEDCVEVLIKFDNIPTLAMMMEAAAQSSAALCNGGKEGYILSCSDMILHKTPKSVTLLAYIRLKISLNTANEIYFEIKEGEDVVSSGTILLLLKE